MAEGSGKTAASQPRKAAGVLDDDKEFHQFVGRMAQASTPDQYADDQLWNLQRTAAGRRNASVIQSCRGKNGRGLDISCFCREACRPDYSKLAACVRAYQEDSSRCREEGEQLTRCVRNEWKQFLFLASPEFSDVDLAKPERTLTF
mmetsp:Transcript_22428/g.36004  ORF Transcript_22428/g.36004 Transcript_22428/m.36004 type:complete len:146 (-) Transcript_22428:21-458(-)